MKFNFAISDTTLGGHKTLFGLLREQNDGTGRHIFIVPDRYTLGVEKEICQSVYPDGTFNVDVCTFSRLAQKSLGKKNRVCLSKEGTVLLLNRVINRVSSDLCYYKNVKSVAFSREMFASLASIRSSGISADSLDSLGCSLQGSIGDKLKDIALIYREYEKELGGKFDTVTRVGWLVKNLENSDYVKDSHFYVLGFNVYSAMQMDFIKKATLVCPSVSVAFCENKGANNDFCYPTRQKDELVAYCLENGVPTETRVSKEILPQEIEFLHREIFGKGKQVYKKCDDSIRICGQDNAYEEVKSVAREIRALVMDDGCRYRDVAVVSNAVEYHSIIQKAFARMDIPIFIDEKFNVSNGFFARFIKLALLLVDGGMDRREVMPFVRHPYNGFSREQTQIFENYCLEFNIDYSIFNKEFTLGDCEIPEYVRKKLLTVIERIPKRAKVSEYCALVESLSELNEVVKISQEYENGETNAEKVYADSEKYLGVIKEIAEISPDESITAGEFCDMLDAVLENMTVSILPRSADAVFVGNTQESRFHDVKVIFVIGANDGYFPVTTGDKLILGCYDTEIMKNNGLPVFPSPEESNFFEQFSVIDLISKPERLYVSYSKTAVDGSILGVGSAVREIKTRLNLEEKPFIEYRNYDEEERLIYRLGTVKNCYFEYLSGAIPPEYIDGAREFLRAEGLLSQKVITEQKMDLLKGFGQTDDGVYKLSPSKMELYFKCPYRSFLTTTLGLQERKEGELKVNEKGSFIHQVLEYYFEKGKELRAMTKSERENFAYACIERASKSPEYKRFEESCLLKSELDGLKKECLYVTSVLTDNMLNSKFTPIMTEKRFGGEEEITFFVDEKKFVFRGVIDRVDEYDGKIYIVDYKTGRVEEGLDAVYTGEKIQLYLYLRYFIDKGYEPIGVFYLPISDGYKASGASYAMKGQIVDDFDVFSEIDTRVMSAPKGKYGSPNVSFIAEIKDDGKKFAPTNQKNILKKSAFNDISEYVIELCKQAIKEIKSGYLAKKPLEKGCEYCPYKRICGNVPPRRKVAVEKGFFEKDGEE